MKKIDKIVAFLVPVACVLALGVTALYAGSECYRPKEECVAVAMVNGNLQFVPCGNTANKPPSIGVLAGPNEEGRKMGDTPCGKIMGLVCNPILGKKCTE